MLLSTSGTWCQRIASGMFSRARGLALRGSQRARSQKGTEKILEVYLFEFSTTDFIDLPIHLSCLPSLSAIDSRHFLRLILSYVSSVAAVVLPFLISDNQTIAVPYWVAEWVWAYLESLEKKRWCCQSQSLCKIARTAFPMDHGGLQAERDRSRKPFDTT